MSAAIFRPTRRIEAWWSARGLAERTGVTREYIASIETGRAGVIYPALFVRLRDLLGFPGWKILEAMGYPTDASADNALAELPPLLTRALSEADADFVDALVALAKVYESRAGGVNRPA